jgi:FkbM family methyltransferase
MGYSSYHSAMLAELKRDRFGDFDNNFDAMQLGEEPPPTPGVLQECLASARERLKAANSLGDRVHGLRPLARALAYYLTPKAYFSRYARNEIAQGEFLYNLLADEPSRALLVKLVAYRILGHRKVKLPRNTPSYWSDIEGMDRFRTAAEPLPIKFMDLSLSVHDLRPLGYDVTCHATAPGLACAVVQKQYEYHHGAVHCKASAGDVVIDAGGCWGETSLYFANEAGPNGAVVAFEFIPSNLAVLKCNRDLNPHLIGNYHVVEHPVWSTSGLKLYYVDWGPGSRVTDDIDKYHSWEGMVETVTIDETLALLGLNRVDFIKMDIEGAELDALKGAEASIRAHRPKLAISLYHKPDDFETIPRYLAGLNLGYRFYLDHHTIYQNETVLFGVPEGREADESARG